MHKQPAVAFLVADAGRARFVLRHSAGRYDVLASFENKPAHRPRQDTRVRTFAPSGATRTALSQDKGRQARDAFAAELADEADRLLQQGRVTHLSLVAPPKMLAAIRDKLSDRAAAHVSTTRAKDLTKLSEADLHDALDDLVVTTLQQAD